MGDVWCGVWCVVCDVGCVVVEVCCVVCGVVCCVVCVFLLSVRAGGVLFKTRTQSRSIGKKENNQKKLFF